MAKLNGVVLYEGPSRIDGAPIVVIAVGLARASTNVKTGGMVQTYILRSDLSPVEALAEGRDVSICGTCPHRPRKVRRDLQNGRKWAERACYVNIAKGPRDVWEAYKRGVYADVQGWDPAAVAALFAGKPVRLGSYGDPAAVPLDVWNVITSQARNWTGYTHQYDRADLRDVLALCQLSADSCSDVEAARAMGVGYFRVLGPEEAPQRGEMLCPASKEAGSTKTCADCGACRGATGARVVIYAHGAGATHFKGGERSLDLATLPVINERRAVRLPVHSAA